MQAISNLVVTEHWQVLLNGIGVTLLVAISGFAIAMVAGLVIVFARRSPFLLVRIIGNILAQLSRNTPILVSLVWIFYALPILLDIRVTGMSAAIAAIALQAAGYQSEVYRAGIDSIERGQFRAAKALGMTDSLAMRRIVLPQALRRIGPPTVNVFSTSLKSTSIISVIAVPDLMFHASRLSSYLYKPLELYTTAAVVYIFLVGITALAADALDRRVRSTEIRGV